MRRSTPLSRLPLSQFLHLNTPQFFPSKPSTSLSKLRYFCSDRTSDNFGSSALSRVQRFYKRVDVVGVPLESATEDDRILGKNAGPDIPATAVQKHFYEVRLDDRPLKTPKGRVIRIFSKMLAHFIAQEWDAQQKSVHRERMRLTGLAFTVVDNPTSETKESVCAKMLDYLETDTLLYFADPDNSLADEQLREWMPVIEWVNRHYSLELSPSHSLNEAPKIPDESRLRLENLLMAYTFDGLVGLNYAADAVKSLLTTLACISHRIPVDHAVKLARLEQLHQIRTWGNVEWYHDIDAMQSTGQLSAGVLFFHLCSNTQETFPAMSRMACTA